MAPVTGMNQGTRLARGLGASRRQVSRDVGQGRFAGSALLLAALTLVRWRRRLSAHDIPRDVTVQAFVKPEGQTPAAARPRAAEGRSMDVEFPRRDSEYVDLARVDPALRDTARLWLATRSRLYEGDTPLPAPRIVSTRFSLESDRSFATYDSALAHVTGPPLPTDTTIFWEQGLLDVLFEYPIQSDRS